MVQYIDLWCADESHPAFLSAIARWKAAGYRVTRKRKFGHHLLRVPAGDLSWQPEIDSLSAQGVVETFYKTEHPEYDEHEYREAGLFSFIGATGKDLDHLPTGRDHILGLSDLADWDESGMCPTCGAGAIQMSPMRIPASSLAKRRMMTYTGTHVGNDLFVSDELRQILLGQHGIELPVREVQQTGRKPPKERWWQVFPSMVLPHESLVFLNMRREGCPGCGTGYWQGIDPEAPTGTFTNRSTFKAEEIDAAVWSPRWYQEVHRAEDGRILSLPQRSIYLRGDLGRAIRKLGLKQVELVPFEWM